ncbi:hypothetical protein [Streptomyces sp. NPDC020607]|uniref:hypothetical protein n=1 Tax=Streptomyces sp. NPDC020607 TaxID=3365082 RepID=UPI0037AFB4DE
MVYAQPMARAVVEPAVRELMRQCADGRERSTTVTLGGDGFDMHAHVRVGPVARGQVEVSLACWVANKDTARYFGDNPPSRDEALLPPEGTATPDEPLTVRVIGHLATRLEAIGAPRPDRDGHLTVTVPFAAPLRGQQ